MNYTHNELPYGKDLHGDSLQQALQELFKEYSSETVTVKLAPCMNSKRNESQNGTIGSKNIKIRHYGGSESSDFRTVCGVAQFSEGHQYVSKTVLQVGITPGSNCTKHQKIQDKKTSDNRQRKSDKKYKIRRRQLQLNKIRKNFCTAPYIYYACTPLSFRTYSQVY